MKKTDLYRSIDSIKPDKELKADILKAVEENDKVTVIKRPLFVPIMVGIMVCVNIGMAAKLIIFNKSQVNLSELKARTSVSCASDSDDTQSNGRLPVDREELQVYIDKFQNDLSGGNWDIKQSWTHTQFYQSEETVPYYQTNDITESDRSYLNTEDIELLPDEYLSVRYVETAECTSEQGHTISFITNHEYIVVYKGGFDAGNIVGIMESNVDMRDDSYEQLSKWWTRLNKNSAIDDCVEKTANKIITSVDPYRNYYSIKVFGVYGGVYLYPAAGSGEEAEAVQCCYVSMEKHSDSDDARNQNINKNFFINRSGEDVTDKMYEHRSNYWKDMVYCLDDAGSDKVLPDIIGLDIAEAERVLEESGMRLGSRSYAAQSGTEYKFNQVMEANGDGGNEVDVVICAYSVPKIAGLPVDEAAELLTDSGYAYEIRYSDGTDPNNDELYVFSCYPTECTPLNPDENIITIIVLAEPDKLVTEK